MLSGIHICIINACYYYYYYYYCKCKDYSDTIKKMLQGNR